MKIVSRDSGIKVESAPIRVSNDSSARKAQPKPFKPSPSKQTVDDTLDLDFDGQEQFISKIGRVDDFE